MNKVLLPLLVVVLAAGAALSTAGAGTSKPAKGKTAICHRTTSSKTPYIRIRVSGKALEAHMKHAADIVPAPASGCPKAVLSATRGGTAFDVALTGEAESPNGDPVATGTATVRLRAGQGQVCFTISTSNLPTAVAAHIHQGGAGASGNVVLPLTTPNASGTSSGCVNAARTLVRALLADPAGFYVNVHTAEFPAGAIRGQLAGTSTSAFGWIQKVDLKGSTEPAAKGTATLRIRKDALQVCYRLHVENITLPATNAHIHRGGAGATGPVAVPLLPPGTNGEAAGCTTSTAAIIDEIVGNPANFYVNVHTKEHPAGAMRGQLG